MRARKVIAGFFLRLIVVYALLMMAWPVVGPGYGAAFRAIGELAFYQLGAGASVRFEPHAPASRDPVNSVMDTVMILGNRRTGAHGELSVSSRLLGYVPSALAAALALATPWPWRRRARVLFWTLLLTQAYIGLCLLLCLLAAFSATPETAAFSFGRTGNATLAFLSEGVLLTPMGSFLGPIIIWIAVTFRAGDWQIMVNQEPGQDTRRTARACR